MEIRRSKLLMRKKYLESELARINLKLSRIDWVLTKDALDYLPFNQPVLSSTLRSSCRAWRRFFESSDEIREKELERCNITIQKTGINGRRFIRREF